MKILFCLTLYLLFLSFSHHINATNKDIIRVPASTSEIDSRFQYPVLILELALMASIEKYGPYEIIYTKLSGTRDRMLLELQAGTTINVHNAPTRPEWEEKTIPVIFPLMKGLLNYRIFLIHKDNINKFKSIETIDDLKRLTAGVGEQWTTTKALRKAGGFKVETGNNYEGLFEMLMAKRFDYLIRGMNEAFREYDERKNKHPEMMVEPYIVMELPLPWFWFVSPKYKKIAERIEFGLQKMKADGSFDKAFYQYYGDSIKKANLSDRKLFRVKNLLLNHHKIYDDPSYWLDPTKIIAP